MTAPDSDPDGADDELIARIGGGDAAAFGALFRRRQGEVYRFALHMTGSPAAADDVTQERPPRPRPDAAQRPAIGGNDLHADQRRPRGAGSVALRGAG